MDNQPIRPERVLEAIEACRPGSDDLADPALAFLADELKADPELKGLFERAQRLDATLVERFRDVPVPDGLAQRITERLASGPATEPGLDDESEDAESAATLADVRFADVSLQRKPTSRRLLVFGAPAVVAASLIVAIAAYFLRPQPYSENDVLTAAIPFFLDDSPEPGHRLSDADHPQPADYPFSDDVIRMPGIRWRTVKGFLDHEGVAYDFWGADGRVWATLYVTACPVDGLPSVPPAAPRHRTAGCSVGAWKKGKLTYVFVVRGDARTYRSCLVVPLIT